AGMYNNYNIGTDYYILSKAQASTGKVNATYGVKAPKEPGSTSRDYYAQFVNMSTNLGVIDLFLYNNHIYHDFTATDAFGNSLTAATVKNSKTLIVKDANGNIIVSVASAGSSFSSNSTTVDLDAYFGTYTNGTETVVLDGSGSITYGDKTGSYTKVEDKDYGFDVYLNNNSEYYRLTLDGNSFTIVKPMVTVSFDAGSYATVEAVEVNMNVAFTLPVVSHNERVFRGWYEDAEYNTAAASKYVPTQNITLYAKWDEKLTLTIVYGNGLEDLVLYYGFGDVTVPVEPEYTNNQAFEGWYLDAEFTVPYVAGAISENTVIYCKWQAPHYLYGSYVGGNVYGTTQNGNTISGSTSTTALVIDENGIITSGRKQGGLISECDENGIFNVDGAYGAADVENGIIMINFGTNSTYNADVMIYVKGATKAATGSSSASYWDAGKVKLMTFTLEGHALSVMHALVYNGRIYGNVTFTSSDSSVTAANAYKAPDIAIYDCHGQLIVKFVNDGTCLRPLDGFEGTYTTTEGTIVVNGVKVINIGGVDGTYSKAAEGSSYTHDAYVDGCYYEVTLNVDGYTAVVNKPMVTITYETFGKADLANSVVNKNIEATLATPENDAFVFRAWYFDVELTKAVPAKFVPTEDVTVYAKWAEKITLTVVYGNGLESVVINYAQGDVTAPVEPEYTNGQAFTGWYLDSDCTQAYVPSAITGSLVIYAGWVVQGPYKVEHTSSSATYNFTYDAETGVWTSANKGVKSSKSSFKITAINTVTVTFQYFASSESATKWDWLSIKHNGTQIYNAGGNNQTVVYSDTVSVTLNAGDTLEFVYSKDSSSNGGLDLAMIKDLSIDGELITTIN
ncbi:MAG: InlB B-repeat-containing protein, partial [Clostridia bacterium]|nr:InlB B-repeat-containing protein [Clostridia bacterium]